MHTTVDERAAVTDPRVTEHARRSAFLLAVHNAVELDGLPAPQIINFNSKFDAVTLHLDENAPGDVAAWCAFLHAGGPQFGGVCDGVTLFRQYSNSVRPLWNGYRVSASSLIDLTDDEAAAHRAQQAEGS